MMDRRKLIVAAIAVVAFATTATVGYAALTSTPKVHAATTRHGRGNQQANNSVVGAWHVTVNVNGSSTPFDTLYLFTRDGGFFRIDGRNNVPGLGVWKENSQHRVSSTFVLFSFDATGHRTGTITANTLGRVRDGVLSGTFTATGVDLAGNPLPGFPKTGTYTGDRIKAQAP